MNEYRQAILQDFCVLYVDIYGVFYIEDCNHKQGAIKRDGLMDICDDFWRDDKNATFCKAFFDIIKDCPTSDRQAAAFGYCVQYFNI